LFKLQQDMTTRVFLPVLEALRVDCCPSAFRPLPGAPRKRGPDFEGTAGRETSTDFGDALALPSATLPVAGVERARWRLELIRCRGGEAACFDVEACDAQGRLALPADLVHGPGQEAAGQQRAAR
jgi:hypothetical protein